MCIFLVYRILVEKVWRSVKECNTLMSTYHDCISLVVRQSVKDEDISLIEDLLTNHVSSYNVYHIVSHYIMATLINEYDARLL